MSTPAIAVPAPRVSHICRSRALGDEITELYGYLNAATFRLLELIRRFDQEQLWHLEGICSCAHWLNWKCGIGMNAAREKVRVANAMENLPKISESFAKGAISYSKVRAMTRVATPETEDYLLGIAINGTAHHVEGLVRRYRRVRRLQEMQDANEQHRSRMLQSYSEVDGTMIIHARLPAETGAIFLKALEIALEEVDKTECRDPGSEEAAADVSAETRDREPASARRADALAEMAECYLANKQSDSSSADRFQVVVHVSAETLAGGEGGMSHIENGPRVSAETSRRICCDTGVSVLREGANGEPLSIGRKSRTIPPGMRRALWSRDNGCRFPGCTHTRFIDGHHIRHWSDGGETSLDNLVLLCRHHHRLVHEGSFACVRNSAGRIEFRAPQGTVIERCGRIPSVPNTFELRKHMREHCEDLAIDAATCVTRYNGGGIDWDLAVGALFH